MRDGLRLLDLGWVSGVRSQTVWHAVAEQMRVDDRAVLSLCSPTEAYISIGYHRRLDELDVDACQDRGLRIFRRRVGGGPVYCDANQLFFQLIVPARGLPVVLDRAWERAMGPAVDAFRSLGVKAELVEGNDLVAEDRKISGTGAARIGEAMVFVGNVIFDFDHDAMAASLAVPDGARAEVARLTRAHLATVHEMAGRDVGRTEAVTALIESYADTFGGARRSMLSDEEIENARALDDLFGAPSWVGAERPSVPSRVKIRSGVAVIVLDGSWITVNDGVVERASFTDGWVPAPGMAEELQRALTGRPVEAGALSDAIGEACNGWERRDELVGAIIGAYRGGA